MTTPRKGTQRIKLILDEETLERIDLVRRPLSRVAWIRLVINNTLGEHPVFRSPSLRRLVHDLPKLGVEELDMCHHPAERVHKGLCSQCGQIIVDLRWPDGKRPPGWH
jgi:hypothetical protein